MVAEGPNYYQGSITKFSILEGRVPDEASGEDVRTIEIEIEDKFGKTIHLTATGVFEISGVDFSCFGESIIEVRDERNHGMELARYRITELAENRFRFACQDITAR